MQRPVCRREATAQRRGRRVLDDLGDGHQVRVGSVQRHALGEGPPVREPRLGLVGAHLRLTGTTPLAHATPAHEGGRDALPDGPPSDAGAHLDDGPDEFVPGDVGQRHPVVVPGPGVPVTAAQSGGVHLHHDTSWRRCRIGNRSNLHRTTEPFQDHCAHDAIVPCTGCRQLPRAPSLGCAAWLLTSCR